MKIEWEMLNFLVLFFLYQFCYADIFPREGEMKLFTPCVGREKLIYVNFNEHSSHDTNSKRWAKILTWNTGRL